MKNQEESNLKIGDNLYWSDSPSILASIVIGFTPKRDVKLKMKSGNYKIDEIATFTKRMAKGFIKK